MNKPAAFPAIQKAFAGPARFTTAEFLAMCETGAFDDMKMELVNGELQRMSPPMSFHALRQSLIIGQLFPLLRNADMQLAGEVGINLGNENVMACDVAIIRNPVLERRLLSPTEIMLVVEISETTLTRDTTLKRLAYAAASIPVYWVIDGDGAMTHIYSNPINGDYADMHSVRFGEPLVVPGTDASIVID